MVRSMRGCCLILLVSCFTLVVRAGIADEPPRPAAGVKPRAEAKPAIPAAKASQPDAAQKKGDAKTGAAKTGVAKSGASSGTTTIGTRTSLFGIEATGQRFAYVFDRSGSMGDYDGKPLAAAKAELLASVGRLHDLNQFHIIFFNHEEPRVFNPTGQPGRLIFADELNRESARKFVERITADGGTRPEPALGMAIRTRPDVIFFLSDGDELKAEAVERLTKANRGAKIFCIEFGEGAKAGSEQLKSLAKKNGGDHKYVDVTKLEAAK